jgi:two-component system LytT family response regulator
MTDGLKISCIVIDDEPMGLELIVSYVEKMSSLKLLKAFNDPIEAFEFIHNNEVDLVFLDINMPSLTGLQLIKANHSQSAFIFTTAYSEYALESYELNVIDYLLKPIEFERFLVSLKKAEERFKIKKSHVNAEKTPLKSEIIKIRSSSKIYPVKLDEILFVEGSGNYLTIHLQNKKVMTLMNMNDLLDLLPDTMFARAHKSFVVSLDKISVLENNNLLINNTSIPIGQTYKDVFINAFNKFTS